MGSHVEDLVGPESDTRAWRGALQRARLSGASSGGGHVGGGERTGRKPPLGGAIVRERSLVYEMLMVCSRPRTIEDVASQQHTVNVLRKALTAANVRGADGGT